MSPSPARKDCQVIHTRPFVSVPASRKASAAFESAIVITLPKPFSGSHDLAIMFTVVSFDVVPQKTHTLALVFSKASAGACRTPEAASSPIVLIPSFDSVAKTSLSS